MTQYYRAPAIQRAVRICEYIAQSSTRPQLIELAEHFQLSKSTIHGILHTLLDMHWLSKDSKGRYSLHEHFLQIFQMVYAKWSVLEIARPFMQEIWKRFNESVFLGVKDGDGVLIRECIGSREMGIRASPGAKLPLLAGALGKVFLTDMSRDELREFLWNNTLPRYTHNSITKFTSMEEEVRKVRNKGVATDDEEYLSGVRAVASPIYYEGSAFAALWVAGFRSQISDEVMEAIQKDLIYSSHIITQLLSTDLALSWS